MKTPEDFLKELPTFSQCADKGINNRTALEDFIYDFEPVEDNEIQGWRERLAEVLQSYADQPKWVDVSTLPTPESTVLVTANKGSIFIMYYGESNNGSNKWFYQEFEVKPYMIPTHWQHLPLAP